MRIIKVHNRYLTPGGEDSVASSELALLRTRGHHVEALWRSNAEFTGFTGVLTAPLHAVWAADTFRRLSALVRESSPDVVHFHNTWLAVSPSGYWAAARYRIPVVQTLHNWRLLCPGALFIRDNKPCELCKRKPFAYPGVYYGCYRRSRSHSLLVAGSVAVHRLLGTWTEKIDLFIVETDFVMSKFLEAGLPAEKIVVKPNFVHPDPGVRDGDGNFALFVGRFTPEKGIRVLLGAWQQTTNIPLRLTGDGPLMAEAVGFVESRGLKNIEPLGWRSREEALALMKGARFLVFPSVFYESFGMTIAEAFACGLPVIASRLGAMAEIVEDGRTGLHFNPGDPMDLAAKVEWAWTHPERMREMGREARREFELKYTAERNYRMLMDIYQLAIERHRAQGS